MTNIIETKKVVANFLTANKFKDFDFKTNKSQLKEKLIESLNSFYVMPEKELLSLIKDKTRRKSFLEHSWTLEEITLKNVGGYPRIGDLPEPWCQNSILDVAQFVQENAGLIKCSSIQRIEKIQKNIEITSKYLYPILLPGGEIRKSEKYLHMQYDSDDGNHRLIAIALSGNDKTMAYSAIP